MADNTESEVNLLRGGQSAGAAAAEATANGHLSPSHTEAPPTADSPECFHVGVCVRESCFCSRSQKMDPCRVPTVMEYLDKSRNFVKPPNLLEKFRNVTAANE